MQKALNYDTGAAVIREFLKSAPSLPGVYRMLNAAGDVLYVGKAKNIRARVMSYVNPAGLNARIMTMVSQVAGMEIAITRTEAEAFLLEANLIKKFKPRYNILLRDDKSFPGILITADHVFPQVLKHRGAQSRKGTYFGPFANALAVNQTLAILQKAFLLRPCSDTIFKNRSRPCLQYQIKRCSAPCVGYISEAEYGGLVEQAAQFLKGKSREMQDELLKEMQTASEAQDYETAAQLRDRVQALTSVQQQARFINLSIGDADLFALHREGSSSCVQVFFFRAGQNYGNKPYFPAHAAESEDAEILSAFIGQFYQTHPAPRLVLTSLALPDAAILEEALALDSAYKIELRAPERGDLKAAMEQAMVNAKNSLQAKLSEQASSSALLTGVAELFGLEQQPKRIEVYDNSHISGTHAVGAMIVAGPEGFVKKHYRRFNFRTADLKPSPPGRGQGEGTDTIMKSSLPHPATYTSRLIPKGEGEVRGGDDYAMMREMLTRRFTRLQKEDPDREKELWPDLLLIDGGVGQLSSATQIFKDLGIENMPYVAISKGPDRNAGREWFHREGQEAFQLPPASPVLHYLQRLRDEAHRFAISSHRVKRSGAIRSSTLDEVSGVGDARRKALLHHFGSAKAVEDASLEELKKVPGISGAMALKLYRHFHAESS